MLEKLSPKLMSNFIRLCLSFDLFRVLEGGVSVWSSTETPAPLSVTPVTTGALCMAGSKCQG